MTVQEHDVRTTAAPRRRTWVIAVLVALAAVAVAAGAWLVLKSDSGVSPEDQAAQQQLAGAPAPGVVRVTVADVEGVDGGSVAGVLVAGTDTAVYDPVAKKDLPIGGFGVAASGDPFTTVQTVNQPGEEFVGLFPYVSSNPVVVMPGTYTLMLWAAPEQLGPYGRWVPGLSAGLRGCALTFTVAEGQGADLTVDGLPGWVGSPSPCNKP